MTRLLVVSGDRKYTGIVAGLAPDCEEVHREPVTAGIGFLELAGRQNRFVEMLERGKSVAVHGKLPTELIGVFREIGELCGVPVDVVLVKDSSERGHEERISEPVMSGILPNPEEVRPHVLPDKATGGLVVWPPVPVLGNVVAEQGLAAKVLALVRVFVSAPRSGGLEFAIVRCSREILDPLKPELLSELNRFWEDDSKSLNGLERQMGDLLMYVKKMDLFAPLAEVDVGLRNLLMAFAAGAAACVIPNDLRMVAGSGCTLRELSRDVSVELFRTVLTRLGEYGGEAERSRQYWKLLGMVWDGAPAIMRREDREIGERS